MIGVVSQRIIDQLAYGKYTRWAQNLTPATLEALLWTVGVFGTCYNAAKKATGNTPRAVFEPHSMHEARMQIAIEVIARIQSGEDSEEPQAGGPHFRDPQPAFSDDFQRRLPREAATQWAETINERQLWTLLWQLDEYAVRVNSSSGPDGGKYPPPTFNVPEADGRLMRKALVIIAEIVQRKPIDLAILRDLFGNPFRPIVVHRDWRTETVLALAQAGNDNREEPGGILDNARLGILADALEEAGCDNAEILKHLRSPGPHFRGCWAVALLLANE
jgi:hypothetical protein